MVLLELRRVAGGVTDGFPDSFGLVWFDGMTTDFLDEQAANVQRGVANHFSIEAESRAASEQAILRIGLEFFWSNARVLAVGGGSDDEANRMFNIPSRLRG